jgi:hypothetical protein
MWSLKMVLLHLDEKVNSQRQHVQNEQTATGLVFKSRQEVGNSVTPHPPLPVSALNQHLLNGYASHDRIACPAENAACSHSLFARGGDCTRTRKDRFAVLSRRSDTVQRMSALAGRILATPKLDCAPIDTRGKPLFKH